MLGRTIGLDLGSHSIKLVEVRHHPRRLEIARVQALRRPADLGPLLREIASANLEGARVICAIPADRVTRRALHFPFRDRKRVEQAVPFEVENETPFALDDIWVDYERTSAGTGGLDVVVSTSPPRSSGEMRSRPSRVRSQRGASNRGSSKPKASSSATYTVWLRRRARKSSPISATERSRCAC
jgi:hypothetical protein